MEAAAVMARASGENFPVASRLLPRAVRAHLLAIYGFARLVDELGDGPLAAGFSGCPGGAGASAAQTGVPQPSVAQRLAALEELEADLDRAYIGQARHPLLRRLEPTLRACGLPREPFGRLIEANRTDQRVSRYETWEQLQGYCALSANPVGELVLHVFGQATPARIARSDAICTALQLAEHCQDVAEDRDRGRIYLPAEDLRRCGATAADLAGERAGAPLRRTIALQIERARGLLEQGAPLIGELEDLRQRIAVAAFLAGGRAALDAIERAGCDVLAGAPRAGTSRRLAVLAATLIRTRGCRRPPDPPNARPGTRVAAPESARAARAAHAYRHCEALTRASAANFYYGIRLLAPARRRAMCAVYAFARRVDDIGDGPLAPAEKLARLEDQERALAALTALPAGREEGERDLLAAAGAPSEDLVLVALGDACARFQVPPDALADLIAGVRMDLAETRYETFEELVLYCRRVAGAIGRACLAVFGLRRPLHGDRAYAQQRADELGVALQLINILRDLREDALLGRIYLPAQDLRRFGLPSDPAGLARAPAEPLARLVRFQAARAREWFERGLTLAPLLDRRSAACLLAMAGIYERLLARIEADPERVLRERVALPAHEKAWVAARGIAGARA